MKTKAEQILKIGGEVPPVTIVKLFWDTLHRLIVKDIERSGEVSEIIEYMMKEIEKGKTPKCDKIIAALKGKIDLVKEAFKLRNGGEKKPDWKTVLKELQKY